MSAVAVVPAAAATVVAATSSTGFSSSTSSDEIVEELDTTTSTIATETTTANNDNAVAQLVVANNNRQYSNPATCRYFLRGICRFGSMCRFSHDLSGGEVIEKNDGETTADEKNPPRASTSASSSSSSSRSRSSAYMNWANAAPFVPGCMRLLNHRSDNCSGIEQDPLSMAATKTTDSVIVGNSDMQPATSIKSWAEVVGANVNNHRIGGTEEIEMDELVATNVPCPYESPCPYGQYCPYSVHLELCKMCDQYCLHPDDAEQRRKHNQECLRQHEQAMELSFAIARSKDKTCGICFDTIMEKSGREKRFGILPNCNHIFCLECIRKWRQAKQFEHKIIRSCPECRIASDFVCPSAFWVETKEEKDKLLNDYRSALGVKDCKYFQKGDGKCPFGNKCFYKHALPNGDLVDVGCPKKARRLRNGHANDVIDLLDIYLWEFIEQRDYRWLELLSNESDDSDDTDWAL